MKMIGDALVASTRVLALALLVCVHDPISAIAQTARDPLSGISKVTVIIELSSDDVLRSVSPRSVFRR